MEDMDCEICGELKKCVSIDVEWTTYSFVCNECWIKFCEGEGY